MERASVPEGGEPERSDVARTRTAAPVRQPVGLVYLRHMDPHSPYYPPPPFDTLFYSKNPCSTKLPDTMKAVRAFKPFAGYISSWLPPKIRDAEFVVAQYDGALAYMDACIQQLLTRVEELGIAEDTLIIVTGDHGETLYDHDCWFDHHGLYEPTLVVPLIFYWPGKTPEGVRSGGLHTRGRHGPDDSRYVRTERARQRRQVRRPVVENRTSRALRTVPRSEFYISECTWMRKQGWRTPIWKFWEALEPDFHDKPPVELYNLVEDPRRIGEPGRQRTGHRRNVARPA